MKTTPHIVHHPNGAVAEVWHFDENGFQEGLCQRFWNDGQLRGQATYRNRDCVGYYYEGFKDDPNPTVEFHLL